MSCDYYFRQWKDTLRRLEELIDLDQEFQRSKIHDKKRCEAVIRLSGMLGEYTVIYNDALECWNQNLQVQKAAYMSDVVKAITNRILELKHDIRKLEYSDTQFICHGLAHHKLTTLDAELDDVPTHIKRPPHLDAEIAEAFRNAEEKRELLRIAENKTEGTEIEDNIEGANWWDEDAEKEDNAPVKCEEEETDTEEMILTKQMATLVQVHERSSKLRREMWEKELTGTLKPPARLELRQRGAKIIQKAFRAYFEIKRRRIIQCKQDELLGIRLCGKRNKDSVLATEKIKELRTSHRIDIERQWVSSKIKLKADFMNKKAGDVQDDYRDLINGWLKKWFDDIKYFYDIPNGPDGGSSLIIKEEIPDPIEWWETYKIHLEEKKANKNKSAQQLKFEQLEAKQEEQARKKEEIMKKKLEEQIKFKLMKNPTMHPGFYYPKSHRTENILEAINHYHKNWDELDFTESKEVKQKFMPSVDMDEIYAQVKIELIQTVDEDMRNVLKILKKALKKDYANNDEPYPEPMKKPRKQTQKHKKIKANLSENIAEKLEDLAFKNILKEYPKTKLTDFLGDHNFAGDDMRCNYEPAPHFSGETRAFWWERCREATHGFHKILVVGPPLSGKTVLIHALATVTESILFELDVSNIRRQSPSFADQAQLINAVVACAKAAQPAVIYIKHIHRFFYKKVPPKEPYKNLDQMKRLLLKMLKKINKTDKIAVIGTCVEPWLMKSGPLLKQFPTVVLVPEMSYSATFRMLSQWMIENPSLPRNLDIHSLACALKGYSYGYLAETLKNFVSPQRIIRIAAHGLSPAEIHEYFLKKDTDKIDFEKYVKWYAEKTPWGKKEAKHIEEQREFKRISQIYAEREKKKETEKKMGSAGNSTTSISIHSTENNL